MAITDADGSDIPLVSIDDEERARKQGEIARRKAEGALGIARREEYWDPALQTGTRRAESVTGQGAGYDAQRQALSRMAQLSRGNMGAQGQAQMHAMRQSVAAQNGAAQRQAAAQAQARGGGNPAARMAALRGLYAQSGAMAAQGEDEAKRRQMDAMRGTGQLAGARRRQGFAEDRARAQSTMGREADNIDWQRGAIQRNTDRDIERERDLAAVKVGRAGSAEGSAARSREESDDAMGGLIQLAGGLLG